MSQIACWYDVTHEKANLPEYLQKLGIRHVICDARHVAAPGKGKEKQVSVQHLRRFKKELAGKGVELAAVTVGWVRADVLDPVGGAAARKLFLQNIKAVGAGGVPVAQLFVMVQNEPTAKGRREQWQRLIAYCKEVAKVAAAAKVKVGVHGSQSRGQMITNLPAYQKLFRAVPSKWFGVTLCLGCLKIHGSDPVKCVRTLGPRMHFLHARDVIMHPDGSWTDVNLGNGQIDYPALQRVIRKLRYKGPIQPEHLGNMSWEQGEEITMARAVGFLRATFDPAPKA